MTGAGTGAVELIIERWTGPDKGEDFHWSLWREGHRIAMGAEAHGDARACEVAGMAACRRMTGCAPDRVTRL